MPKQEHVHKYKRHRFKSGNEVYFCALPDCNKKIMPALTLGKKCICWRCGNEFIMTDYAIRLAKPHCEICHHFKGAAKHDITEQVEEMKQVIATTNPILSLSERLAAISNTTQLANDEEDI